ncbi:MAG TPA: hypothetical protein V6C58_26810 [Allocoleopsis sp.]
MTTLKIKNLSDELYTHVQNVASQKNLTIDETIIYLLNQSYQSYKLTINQEKKSDMSAVLQRIRSRPRVNPQDFGLKDSTILIQEDRNR